MACAALKSSMARMRSRFCSTCQALVAALAPMLTWSSCPCDDCMESTEAGVHSVLFWLTMEAAVYCGIIKPELRPGLATRKWQSAFAFEQLEGASFGDVAQLGHGDAEVVERQRQRLSVEIAGRDDQVFVGKDRGVVGDGVDLHPEDIRHVGDGVFGGAVNLRYATKGVGVLHVFFGPVDEPAAFQQVAYSCGGFDLSFVVSDLLYQVVEGFDTSVESVQRQRTDDVGKA